MDPTKWTANDFKVLRVSLQQFLPLIGFHKMTNYLFFEKVSPFGKIFELRIYKELVQYFTLSDENVSNMNILNLSLSIKYPSLNSMVTYIDSYILFTKHAVLTAIWIQQVEQTVTLSSSIYQKATKIPYNFKLLLCGSCDYNIKNAVLSCMKEETEYLGPSFGFDDIISDATKIDF
ncbi:hypothetical protein C2G38_2192177 [Gigaspora rosea]|uniref:Uncharacterized protein n=1 Tax=Gigaspora rosea TaxID=44941 RepID=A0A397UZ82_9GLOM|nr:hypothetical protein C2G38_2192177 [Gigaspora rosea]